MVSKTPDPRTPWTTHEVGAEVATRGFHHITLTLASIKGTADVLTDIFGYQLIDQHVNRYRFATDTVAGAALVDLVEVPGEPRGHVAAGSVHHVAFRVKDDAAHLHFRNKIAAKGFNVTPQIDRDYFHSVYFREPGGVLFEIATDTPGFDIDEPLLELGRALKLPPWLEPSRDDIAALLPTLRLDETA